MAGVHPLRRWATFNLVGAMGVALQLGVVAALRHLELHYVAATAIAVEAAVLHNFWWHQCWTWRDRRATTSRAVAVRLVRFHVTNGAISVVGNIAIVIVLSGGVGFDPLLANAAAIGICSIVNFAAGTTFVFRTAGALAAMLVLG